MAGATVDAELRKRPRWTPAANIADLEAVQREFYRLADYLTSPAVDGVQFTVQAKLPERPRQGLLMYFAAGVAGAEGLYQFKAGAWTAL